MFGFVSVVNLFLLGRKNLSIDQTNIVLFEIITAKASFSKLEHFLKMAPNRRFFSFVFIFVQFFNSTVFLSQNWMYTKKWNLKKMFTFRLVQNHGFATRCFLGTVAFLCLQQLLCTSNGNDVLPTDVTVVSKSPQIETPGMTSKWRSGDLLLAHSLGIKSKLILLVHRVKVIYSTLSLWQFALWRVLRWAITRPGKISFCCKLYEYWF